jgi:peptidoglycan/xylan/chitin deacetylase (PgdA/CDA1 family)
MRFATAQGFNSGDQFFTYLKDAFDTLYEEGTTHPKMMSVGLHLRLVGRPGRAAALARFIDYVRTKVRQSSRFACALSCLVCGCLVTECLPAERVAVPPH